jgi:site-specific recombinase XerD
MIENYFVWRSLRALQRDAPLLTEREEYLSHLIRAGMSTNVIKTNASVLLRAVFLLKLETPRRISHAEITQASIAEETNEGAFTFRKLGRTGSCRFISVTTRWLRFSSLLAEEPFYPQPFDSLLTRYVEHLCSQRKTPASVRGYKSRIKILLRWLADKYSSIEHVSLNDVDSFLESLRAKGWKHNYTEEICTTLRDFFRWCGGLGCCDPGIARGIRGPRVAGHTPVSAGPSWKDVRRMLRPMAGAIRANYRARAILHLCSIYALRTTEVINLRLDDFDWHNETFTVRRLKNERVQQFPIQHEVGDAILEYLRNGRPKCSCRNMFVTMSAPFRPMIPACVFEIVSGRMKSLNIVSEKRGAHALRHACATRLLKTGSPLRDIADFLGHCGLSAVSIYARHDSRLLRKVAAFKLGGIL